MTRCSLLAPTSKRPKEERGWDGAEGVQLPKQGGHDAVKACAGRESCGRAIGDHAVVQAVDLDGARQPGKSAAQQERDHDLSAHPDPAIAGCVRVLAHGPDAIAQCGAPQRM